MPNWLRIRNEGFDAEADFGLQWNGSNGEMQTYDLGIILFETSCSFQLDTLTVPNGENCWVVCGTDQSDSNFTINWSDNSTAAYNYGLQGFSLNIEPN